MLADDLVAWLRQQLDDDEQLIERNSGDKGVGDGGDFPDYRTYDGEDVDAANEYLARFNPQRMRAEVDAKRKVVDAYVDAVRMHRLMTETDDDGKWDWLFKSEALEGVVRLLALPYVDRPGYRQEWRPAE